MESLKKAQKKYYEKRKNDTDFKAMRNNNVKAYYYRKKTDPNFMEMRNEKAKEYYKNNREKVLEKKKIYYNIKQNEKNNDSNSNLQ